MPRRAAAALIWVEVNQYSSNTASSLLAAVGRGSFIGFVIRGRLYSILRCRCRATIGDDDAPGEALARSGTVGGARRRRTTGRYGRRGQSERGLAHRR